MRFHDAYIELEAPNHRKFGELLGRRLAAGVHQDWAALKTSPDYAQNVVRAQEYLAPTRHAFPHLVEELEGYAAGAEIPFNDAWLLCLEDELERGEHCTTAVTNNARLMAHNEDWDVPGAVHRLYVLRRKIGPTESLELYYRNTLGGNAVGINRYGLFQAINSLHATDGRAGVPRNIIARHASDADSAKEAVERITFAQRGSGYAHILVDVEGVRCVEASASRVASWSPSLPFFHANTMLDAGMQELQQLGSYHGSAGRLRSAKFQVTNPMDAADLAEAFDDKTQGPEDSLHNEDTIGRVIVDVDKRVFAVWLKREAGAGWVAYQLP